MLKMSTLVLLGWLITTLSGCGSASRSASTPGDVSGTWTGSTATGTKRVVLHLQQTGTNVTGTLTGASAHDEPVQGTIEGNTIQLTPKSGSMTGPRLVVRGDLMDGELGGVPAKFIRSR